MKRRFTNSLRSLTSIFLILFLVSGFFVLSEHVNASEENTEVYDYCKQNRFNENEPQQYWCGVISARALLLTTGAAAGGYFAKKTKPLIGKRLVTETKDIQREIMGGDLRGAKVNGGEFEIPRDWERKNAKGEGFIFFERGKEDTNWIRLIREGKNQAYDNFEEPYYRRFSNGQYVDKLGNPTNDDNLSHIIIESLEI
jgi:hypothetical protein